MSRDALSKLSRVSRDWSDVANIYLWETLDSLLPLLCLMPADLWYLLPSLFNFTRPLTPVDWTPVLRRSCLVKVLSMREEYNTPYAAAVLHSMYGCPPPFTLLPRLRSLSLNMHRDPRLTRTRFYLRLIPPSLRVLQVTGPWPQGIGFTRIAEACPGLEWLDCDCSKLEDTTGGTTSDLACGTLGWQSLTGVNLRLGRMGLAVLPSLARLPSLSSISIRCFESDQNKPILPNNSFPSLSYLMLCGIHLPVVDTILCSWTMRRINTLSLTPYTSSSPDELLHTIRCMREHCEALGLLELLIDFGISDPDRWPLRFEHLAPLAHFQNLLDVTVRGPWQTDINDGEFAQLAKWWPRMKRFMIGMNIYRSGGARLCTLSTLHSFAMGCGNVTHFTLPLTAAVIPSVDSSPTIRHLSLKTLSVGDAPIEDPQEVALFLSQLFPNLEKVQYKGGIEDDEEDDIDFVGHGEVTRERMAAWKFVDKMLPVLRKKEAQTWASSFVYYEAMLFGFRHALASAGTGELAG
ncbi:hypothetical protein BD626DRAFT_573137 [Schizophyllum amplum]|uniref:F-box domain-containing protein n=1 Tax=Schizophyllum amplum TaxID=97359 RepID=A0A550C246_9AGAR|nr:hypothetical protein BD626DRAFT_573137 [Auriculariopsis ampla]